ncbi:GGDEF domain-containing phosphodiesterase [Pseudoalteromonas fuliginea]|uniref:putative bifunctional diguanylate cyclase/phosphodiesterase n=1 Tax=Pseudoalteromonas fuliginea TaxID=1872678 RepID=UPI00316EE7FA
MHFFSRFFLLEDHHLPTGQIPNWRVSALRIIFATGILLCLAISLHKSKQAAEFNILYFVGLSVSFFFITTLLLAASKRYYIFCAHALLLSIVAASLCINLFVTDLELAKIGSIYMFSCPLIALMLIGCRTAIFYAVLNIIPFYIIVNDINLSSLSGVSTKLSDEKLYITSLIFLSLNVCIPLAFARTIVAAKRLNKSMKSANTYLKDKNDLYRALFTESNKAKIIVDENFVITDFNQHAIDMFDIKKHLKEHGVKLFNLLPSLDVDELDAQDQIVKHKNSFFRTNYQHVMSANYRVYDFYDCTQEQLIKQNLTIMEQENKRLRFRDPQTKLPNRGWFETQCNRLTIKYHKGFYIVVTQTANSEYLNLKFTKIDSQALLISAFKRLKKMPEGPLLCAHVGVGKLAFIVGTHSANELKDKLLVNIKNTLDEAYNVLGNKCQQTFLFGFARYPNHGKSSAEVLTNACEALKLANSNSPICSYSEEQSQAFIEKYEISMLLDEALQQGDLSVYYQPKVNAKGECIGLEALTRWHSSILGNVSPVVFIPIAEEYRMISRLTDLIIQKVCAQIAQWSTIDMPSVPIAINISLIDFSQPDFISKLVKSLADFNVKPQQIELELTETSLEANQGHSLKLMQTLQSWGFIISVDDFGVGYSNIARLAHYPINKLKLDRSLISQITHSSRQKSLVKAILVMCEELDIKCVAEGVETQEQVAIMAEMGCKEFQGFYFAQPITVKNYEAHINKHGTKFIAAKNNEKQVF